MLLKSVKKIWGHSGERKHPYKNTHMSPDEMEADQELLTSRANWRCTCHDTGSHEKIGGELAGRAPQHLPRGLLVVSHSASIKVSAACCSYMRW